MRQIMMSCNFCVIEIRRHLFVQLEQNDCMENGYNLINDGGFHFSLQWYLFVMINYPIVRKLRRRINLSFPVTGNIQAYCQYENFIIDIVNSSNGNQLTVYLSSLLAEVWFHFGIFGKLMKLSKYSL